MPRRDASSSVAIAPRRSPVLPLHRREHAERGREARMLPHDRAGGVHRRCVGAGVERRNGALQLVGRPDQRLRIVRVGVDARAGVRARGDVAERLQPLPRVGAERRLFGGGPTRLEMTRHAAQQRFERARALRVARKEVGRLARVGSKVVELRNRQVDQLVVARGDAGQRRPVPREVGVHGLDVRRRGFVPLPRHYGDDGASLELRRRGDAHQIERGGREVDEAHQRVR